MLYLVFVCLLNCLLVNNSRKHYCLRYSFVVFIANVLAILIEKFYTCFAFCPMLIRRPVVAPCLFVEFFSGFQNKIH